MYPVDMDSGVLDIVHDANVMYAISNNFDMLLYFFVIDLELTIMLISNLSMQCIDQFSFRFSDRSNSYRVNVDIV